MFDLKQAISEFLAEMRDGELGFDVRCDKEGIRVYLPDGTSLGTINVIARILKEILDIEEHEITIHRDPDDEEVYLFWVEEVEE